MVSVITSRGSSWDEPSGFPFIRDAGARDKRREAANCIFMIRALRSLFSLPLPLLSPRRGRRKNPMPSRLMNKKSGRADSRGKISPLKDRNNSVTSERREEERKEGTRSSGSRDALYDPRASVQRDRSRGGKSVRGAFLVSRSDRANDPLPNETGSLEGGGGVGREKARGELRLRYTHGFLALEFARG